MKRKIVAIMLAAVVVSASVVGCGENKTTETESKKVQTTTVATTKKTTSNHDAIKKYIEKADKIVIVKDAKNLDMEKAVSSMVSESQKDNVESVTVDDSKVDSTKAGTYPLTITVKLKDETAVQKEETTTDNAKTESAVKKETSKTDNKTETTAKDEVKDTKTETNASESKDTESKDTTTDNKQESDKNTIKDTVDVTVADKDKADDLLNNGSAVVGDDSKVEVKEDKEIASNDTKKEETDKKTEEKKEETSKKEETKKDDTKKEETKKDTSSKTESSSSDKKQNNATNTATPSKPAASKPAETKPAPSKPSTNTNSGSNQGNSTPAPSKPAHQHNYVAQTHVVHHEATGHNEQYVVQAAWDETVTTYEDYAWECCNVCGADCTADPWGHMEQHALAYEGGGYHTEYGTRPVTTTVHHDAVYGTRWVQDSAAWDETVVDGYVCSCGARK